MNSKGKGEIRLQGQTGSRAVGNAECVVTLHSFYSEEWLQPVHVHVAPDLHCPREGLLPAWASGLWPGHVATLQSRVA